MKFIKLTDSNTSTQIYVNIEAICAFYKFGDEYTIIQLKSDEGYWVLEQPEEILKMIDNALHGNNKS